MLEISSTSATVRKGSQVNNAKVMCCVAVNVKRSGVRINNADVL